MPFKKSLIIIIAALSVIGLLGYIFRDYLSDQYAASAKRNISEIPTGARLLVVAPHSDDETLGCSGFIKKVLDKSGTVQVVIITNGDGSRKSAMKYFFTDDPTPQEYIDLGRIRHQESLAAMGKLGVPNKNVTFLGYPDGGTAALWSTNWKADKPFKDSYTEVNRSPYDFTYNPGVSYAGENEAKDLQNIIDEFKPTIVLYPHPDDHHKDHWATFAFVKYALEQARLDKRPEEFVYLVHFRSWPAPFGRHPNQSLNPPRSLANQNYEWYKLPLSNKDEENKIDAIRSYKTQLKNNRNFLISFQRKNELYSIYPDANLKSNSTRTYIKNPGNDYLMGLLHTIGGIDSIQASRINNKLLMEVKTKKILNPKYKYLLHITLFNKGQEPEKLDIIIEKNKTKTLFLSHNKLQNNDIKVTKDKNTVAIEVILPAESKLQNLLMSGSILINGKTIDRTAWKFANL